MVLIMKKILLLLFVAPSIVFSQTKEQMHSAVPDSVKIFQKTGLHNLVWGKIYFSTPKKDFMEIGYNRTEWSHCHCDGRHINSRELGNKYFWDKSGKIPIRSDSAKWITGIDTITVKRKR